MRWLLTWVLWLGVTGCAAAQYEARSYDASAPAEAPHAPQPTNLALLADDGSDYVEAEEASVSSEGAAPAAAPPPPPELASPGVPQAGSDPDAPSSVVSESGSSATQGSANGGAELPKQLLLIYRAHLVLAVFETRATLDEVERLARSHGGYLVQRNDDTIQVRIPVAKFEAGLREAAALGDELSRQVTAEDVSDQYRDLKIRLRNAEAVRERLAALLARAADVKEALLVEEQLGRITNTIEQIKGKLKVLDELIAFSTITVTVHSQASHDNLKPRVTLPFPWLRELGLSNLLDLEER